MFKLLAPLSHNIPHSTSSRFIGMCHPHTSDHSSYIAVWQFTIPFTALLTFVFCTGKQITVEIEQGTKTWSDLWEDSTFFTDYKHYVCITACAATEQDRVECVYATSTLP